MVQLSELELENVNGGTSMLAGFIIGWAGGHALDYLVEGYHGYWEDAVNSGWGSNPGTPPPNAGFGTI